MKWKDREESTNVEDRRKISPTTMAVGGGSIVVVIVALLLGLNPQQVANFLGQGQGGQQPAGGGGDKAFSPEEEELAKFSKVIFHDTEVIWDEQFREQKVGKEYVKPILVLYSGDVKTDGCGLASAAVGPFYCSGDQKVYIDLSFYQELEKQLKSPGEFARAYVIAHEVGHHVQNLLGYSKIVDRAREQGRDKVEMNRMSVRLELQADYLAGVWAHHAQEKFEKYGGFLEKGDVEAAMNAADHIGDDRLQLEAQGRVRPDSFTHGKSAQRMKWLKKGLETGSVEGAAELFKLRYEDL
jgi:predicted metalloprotease